MSLSSYPIIKKAYMISILTILFIGIAIGFLFRRQPLFRHADRAITLTVYLLLFIFGVTIGSNRTLIERFSEYGIQALLLALAGVAGSASLTYLVLRLLKKKGGRDEK